MPVQILLIELKIIYGGGYEALSQRLQRVIVNNNCFVNIYTLVFAKLLLGFDIVN